MRKELALSPVILAFDDLDELLSTIEEEIDLHKKVLARYGDRLGVLLRDKGGSESLQKLAAQDGVESDRTQTKNKKRGETEEGGWMSFESEEYTLKVATPSQNASSSSYEITQLFKITEALKTKVSTLEITKRFLNELPSKGFRADQRFFVVFREGIPRHVIPTNESRKQMRRFRYSDQFEINVLE